MKLRAKAFWAAPLAMTLTLILGACGGSAPESASLDSAATTESAGGGDVASGEPVDGGWLVSRLGGEPAHLNRVTLNDASANRLARLVQEPLLMRNNETLELEPHLAKSYEISKDKLTYTFHLRDDVKFSDGVAFTAHDVKFSYDKIMDPKVDSGPLRNYFLSITGCEVVDDHTVRFTCEKPYFKTLVVLGEDLTIFPKHIYETGDFNKHPNNRAPIGSGPYVFEKWDTGQELSFVRNEDYWGVKPHVKRRVMKIITDDNAAFQVLERQDLDIMGMTPDQWVTRTNTPSFEEKFSKHVYYTPFHSYIGWNMRKPTLSDRRVRTALTHLLDRELILKTIYHGYGRVVSQSVFVDSVEYNHDLKPYPFDPAKAAALLDEAGWVDSDKDGVRDREGIKLELEMLIVANSDTAQQVTTLLKEQCGKVGINLSLRPLEWATFIESLRKRTFDGCLLGWVMDPENDPYQIWHSSQTVDIGSNHVGFSNEEADQILEDARKEFDQQKRIQMYNRLNEIIHHEQPYTFLFCPPALVAVDKRFENVHPYPLGMDSKEWWVPEHLQRYN